MATVTSNKVSAGVMEKALRVGLVAVTAVYSPNGSMSSGDVIQMIKVPVNSRVVYLRTDYALSGNGSYTVGDGIDADRYIAATLGSVSAGSTQINNQSFVPYTYSADDTIDITLSTSTNPSSGAVYMTAVLTLDP